MGSEMTPEYKIWQYFLNYRIKIYRNLVLFLKYSVKHQMKIHRELIWDFSSYDVFDYSGVIYDLISGTDVDLKFHTKNYII